MPRALTKRQRRFVEEYLRDLNGKQAAIRAGYKSTTAAKVASALLKNPQIAAEVAAAQEQRAAKKRATADRVMTELGRMAFANIRDYVAWDADGVKLRDAALLHDDETAAIADIEPKGNGKLTRLKLYDKLAALNALAKHLGMIGGKTALGPRDESRNGRDAKAELRARLQRIMKGEEK